jgi:hypothetical protein
MDEDFFMPLDLHCLISTTIRRGWDEIRDFMLFIHSFYLHSGDPNTGVTTP